MAQAWYTYPISRGFLWTPANPGGHSGNDVVCPCGTPLTALLPGTVVSLGMEPWGGQVNIQSTWPGIGDIVVSYLHERGFAKGLAPGVFVVPGQIIGDSGEPPPGGRYGAGCHCHFEVNTGRQPPYMGHVGPPSPIDSAFLLDAAKAGTLGDVSADSGASSALDAGAANTDSSGSPLNTLATWLGLPSFSLGTGQISRAPLSPGFLGVVEHVDEAMEFPNFDSNNIVGWAVGTSEAVIVRGTVVLLGLIILLIVVWNVAAQAIEAETQAVGNLAGPVAAAAVRGGL